MSGNVIYTNKDESLKNSVEEHFKALEEVGLMGGYKAIEHESKYEWKFENVYDAIMASNYLSNHFEYCHRF